MALIAVWVTLTLMTYHCLWTEASDQLKVVETPSQKIKRDVRPVSPDDISSLWTDIQSAFRFLEQQPAETHDRDASMTEDAQRFRKNEKINKLPFTQHNFIRFGKRNQEEQSTSLQSDNLHLSTDLLDVMDRLKNIDSLQSDNQLYDSNPPLVLWGSDDTSSPDINIDKKQLHNFVRFGKKSSENDNFDKRQLHNFVRFGKRSIQNDNLEKRQHNFVRIGKKSTQDDNPEKKQHNFVRFGKRTLQTDDFEKRQLHQFVRFGKKSLPNDNFEKRQLHNFVRFGRTSIPLNTAPSQELTDDSSSTDWY
uniref:Fmrfamide-related peptide 2 n=1 Tax=Deroceras reticulatum TaxID=145610 RepID=A0A1X9WEF7_DERRE|nr:fmrfamide-related peptide 2 [Deroceras reticulatum]